MQTSQTTPLRLLPEQKSKHKYINEEVSDGKRSCRRSQQMQSFDTVRKYTCNKMLNQDSDFTYKTNHSQDEDIASDKQQSLKPQLSVIEQQHSVVSSSMPLRQKYGHLLHAYQSANYSIEQRKLINSQIKLDELLNFLKLHRQKVKGENFSIIRKTMRQNYEIDFDLQQLKQILFLIPDFYIYTSRKDQMNKIELILALPDEANFDSRRNEFRSKLYDFLAQNQAFTKNPNFKIPCISFQFEQKNEAQKRDLVITDIKNRSMGYSFFGKQSTLQKLNPFDALKKSKSEKFQQLLLQKIKENQKRLKQQKQKQKQIKCGVQQLLAVFDELPKIFKKRQKSSMFKSSIVEDLDRSLNIKFDIISKILEILLEKYCQFFKVIEHRSGSILQIQLKLYSQIRKKIISDQQTLSNQDIQKQLEKKEEENKSVANQIKNQKSKSKQKSKQKSKSRQDNSRKSETPKKQQKSTKKQAKQSETPKKITKRGTKKADQQKKQAKIIR